MSKSTDRRMDELKCDKVCMDCIAEGITINWPTECLQFDHRNSDEKSGNIRQFLHHDELLLIELAKCDVVCANHHAIRTRKRGVSEKTRAAIKVGRNKPGDKERDSQIQKDLWAKNREKRIASQAELKASPEYREKMRIATSRNWKDPEIRAKRSEGQLRSWDDLEQRQRRGAAQSEANRRPEVIANRAAGQRRRHERERTAREKS